MKLRIQGNSIRLRLTVAEVASIGAGAAVEATTAFPSGVRFAYRLEPRESLLDVTAEYEGHAVIVGLPASLGARWAVDPEHVSIQGCAGETKLLIEKDFTCLEPRAGEDQTELFANPHRT